MIKGGIVGGYYGRDGDEMTRIVNVANQTELSAVSTSGQAVVRVTANFGIYYRGDTLMYNPTASAWDKITDARYFKDGFVVWWGAGQTEELPEGTLPESFGSLYKRHQRLVNECTETHKVWRYCGNSDQYQR